jgi:hypothetical protein
MSDFHEEEEIQFSMSDFHDEEGIQFSMGDSAKINFEVQGGGTVDETARNAAQAAQNTADNALAKADEAQTAANGAALTAEAAAGNGIISGALNASSLGNLAVTLTKSGGDTVTVSLSSLVNLFLQRGAVHANGSTEIDNDDANDGLSVSTTRADTKTNFRFETNTATGNPVIGGMGGRTAASSGTGSRRLLFVTDSGGNIRVHLRKDKAAPAQASDLSDDDLILNKGEIQAIVNDIMSALSQGLKTPELIDKESGLPDAEDAPNGTYYVVQNLDVTAAGQQGRAWKNDALSETDWQIVIDNVFAPDEEWIGLTEGGALTIPADIQALINGALQSSQLDPGEPTASSTDLKITTAKRLWTMMGAALSTLATTAKTIVGAINELAGKFNASTGHSHNGTDSKKIAYSDLTGAPQGGGVSASVRQQDGSSVNLDGSSVQEEMPNAWGLDQTFSYPSKSAMEADWDNIPDGVRLVYPLDDEDITGYNNLLTSGSSVSLPRGRYKITLIGAGGGGRGASGYYAGGGGNAGGMAVILAFLEEGTYSYSIGAAGTGAANTTPGTGGNTVFYPVPGSASVYVTASGGNPGQAYNAAAAAAVSGSLTGTLPSAVKAFFVPGQQGERGNSQNTNAVNRGGRGGGTAFGFGGNGGVSGGSVGQAGQGYGAGGGGAYGTGTGGAGTQGCLFIESLGTFEGL